MEERKHLRYKIRADRPEEEIQEMKEQIKVLTEKIGTLRKEAALCDGIAARSKVIEEKFKMVREEKRRRRNKAMNTSGEAADQVVRMSLEVGEVALKISGTGAKHLAVMLYAVLKEKKKTKGRVRLETLVKSGRPLTVFSVKESDLKQFVQEAKRYGVLYCAVRNPKRKQ